MKTTTEKRQLTALDIGLFALAWCGAMALVAAVCPPVLFIAAPASLMAIGELYHRHFTP